MHSKASKVYNSFGAVVVKIFFLRLNIREKQKIKFNDRNEYETSLINIDGVFFPTPSFRSEGFLFSVFRLERQWKSKTRRERL